MGLFNRKLRQSSEEDLADTEQVNRALTEKKIEMPTEIVKAHEHCTNNKAEIRASKTCGCFYCLQIFPAHEVYEWVNDEDTAICPKCGIDSVIGDESGIEYTPQFLQIMHKFWF